MATGSELLLPGDSIEAGKIYNSNGVLLQSLVTDHGGIVSFTGQVADDPLEIEMLLKQLTQEHDLILTTGGVSVGDFDFIANIASAQDCLFNKLMMRPGSPTTAFIYDETPVIALSGNPGACFTGFYLLVEPLLQRFREQASSIQQKKMVLAEDYRKTSDFDRYVRGVYDAQGVKAIGSDKSSALGNLHTTRCLFKISANQSYLLGSEVDVWLLPYK